MPLYEYLCEQDGERIELLRPILDADKPVEDPRGKGRQFRRVHSTFATQGSSGPQSRGLPMGGGGSCACGKPHGSCSRPV